MIPRKRLQLLLYILCIFYVFGEDNLNDLQRTEIVDDATEISSIYTEHTTFENTNNLYNETSTKSITDYPEETTEFTENDLLTSDNSMDNSTDLLDSSVSVSDFTEDSTYVFSSSTEDIYNESTSEIPETEIPICDITDDVEHLTVYSTDTEWLCLSWSLPCYNNESFIYLIDICSDEKCSQVNETSSQFNATGLDPCTEYTITVKISDGIWESSGTSITTTTSFNITAIGEVQNLTIKQTTTDVIQIIWDAPMIHPMCVFNYLIRQCIENNCYETFVASTEYFAKDLEPCKKYTFTVVAVAQITQSNGIDISGKLDTPRPGKPRFPIVEADAFSLYVHWLPPEIGAACIKYYHVTVNPHSNTLQPVDANVMIDGLHACTTYNIYINAVDEDNRDGEMIMLQSETVAIVSKAPMLNITDPPISVNSIFFTWKIEKIKSNCLVKSLIAVCNYTASNGHGYDLVNGEAETSINSPIVHDFLFINSTIENISPFTSYTCWAYTTNEAGASEYSEPLNITTLEDVPSAPLLNIASNIDSQFVFAWDTPEYLPGTLQDFEITLVWEPLFPIPDWCPQESPSSTIHLNGSTFTYKFTESQGFTSYTARIRAKTTAGWGNYSEPLLFQSQSAVPGMVSNFTFVIKENENNTNILDTILMWALPCSLNGMIEYFNVSVHGIRNSYTPHSFSVEKYIIGSTNKNDMFSINLRELKGEYNYTFKVSAKVARVNSFGTAASYSNIIYPAGIPPQPEEEYIKSITIDPYKSRRSTTSAAILLPLFSNLNGNVLYYSIIVSEMGYNPASSTRFKLNGNSWPNASSWEESMLQDFTIPYQATRPHWDPYPNYVADYGHMKAVKYVIGEDTNCKEISSNTKNQVYCNGPLKPDTWYNVRMRAFTHGGYTDSIIFVVKTNAEINVGIVIGIVFGILFLGILTTMMLLVRKCSPQAVLRRFLHSDMPGSPVPAPFTRKKFIAHCQQLVDNPGKLSNEFRLLQTLSVDLQMPTNTACLQANRKKNRYSDILPYDFSRVKLEVIDNDPNTDYINASFIRGFTGEDEYIACQGPKEETTYDFWRMVDQYNVNIIIMLTQLMEKGKEKCHQYFPTIKETFRYENMTIRCTSELDYRTYTQRTLLLQKENKKRNIIHLHFKDWPDHDVPEDFDPMIHFCQIMRRNILANEGLIIIHCSAGIGRTGTLIAIDILLQHLRDNRKLDVFGTVYRLRHHRINMVQRESQYAYIYNCIKQVLKNPYCLKTYKPPPVNPVYENISKKEKTASNSNTNLVNNSET